MKNLLFLLVVVAVVSTARSGDGHYAKEVAGPAFRVARAAHALCSHYKDHFADCMDHVNVMLDEHVENVQELMVSVKDVEEAVENECNKDEDCMDGKFHSLKNILHYVNEWVKRICEKEDKPGCAEWVFATYLDIYGYDNILDAMKNSQKDHGNKRNQLLGQVLREYIERESK